MLRGMAAPELFLREDLHGAAYAYRQEQHVQGVVVRVRGDVLQIIPGRLALVDSYSGQCAIDNVSGLRLQKDRHSRQRLHEDVPTTVETQH